MRGETRLGFLVRRWTENIQTQVVPHNAGEQTRIAPASVRVNVSGAVLRWLDRRPWRRPERIDAGGLVEDLGDVSALLQDRHSEIGVLDSGRAAAAILVPSLFSHGPVSHGPPEGGHYRRMVVSGFSRTLQIYRQE